MNNLHQKININYERLLRQYEINVLKFDKPALLDLSHMLRIWVEMKNDVQTYLDINESAPIFTNYQLNGKMKKLLWGKDYIFTCFPGSITTMAANDIIMSSSDNFDLKKFTIMSKVKREKNGGLSFKNFLIIFSLLTSDEESIFKEIQGKNIQFTGWMQSEIVKLSFNEQNLPPIGISREILIKRVANILGGSHPEGNGDSTNKYDPYINKLMQYDISGLPSPYLMLLKTAKDILEKIKI